MLHRQIEQRFLLKIFRSMEAAVADVPMALLGLLQPFWLVDTGKGRRSFRSDP